MEIQYENSRILVIGLGIKTGLSVSNFLVERGATVYASDKKSEEDLKEVTRLLNKNVIVFSGDQSPQILDTGFDLIVLSPGVPQSIPLIVEARMREIPVISEVELAFEFIKGKIVAITGTDGKSTTTSLVGHVLKEIGIKTFVGGNIGIPLVSFVCDTNDDSVTVLELSSFQLETIVNFKPDVAAILNVSPDHLDRYDSMNDYFSAKLNISKKQTDEDFFIYYKDDDLISKGIDIINADMLDFSLNDENSASFYKDGCINVRFRDKTVKVLDCEKMQIMGIHNILNSMAAILMILSVLKKIGIEPDFTSIEQGFYSFKGLPHRMERLGDYKGRCFINDSKATTVGAVQMALNSLPNTGILILGGQTKGDDYSRLAESMRGRIKHLVLIGESSEEFGKLFGEFSREFAESMDDAVVKAVRSSESGDVILLSPACASFDMFRNFEERGDRFKESFQKLNRGELTWT